MGGVQKIWGGGLFRSLKIFFKLLIFKVLCGPGGGTGAVAHGSRRGKTQERQSCVFNDCKKRMLNRMKIYNFLITRASEASERKFFGVLCEKMDQHPVA